MIDTHTLIKNITKTLSQECTVSARQDFMDYTIGLSIINLIPLDDCIVGPSLALRNIICYISENSHIKQSDRDL